jgi:hypothetical protein
MITPMHTIGKHHGTANAQGLSAKKLKVLPGSAQPEKSAATAAATRG